MAAPSLTKLQEIFEVEKLSAEQEKATDSLLAKKDVFLSLLGQVVGNLCYMALPIFYEHSNSLDVQVLMPQVLIISPLLTIMKEQTDLLVSKGFTATFNGKTSLKMPRYSTVNTNLSFLHQKLYYRTINGRICCQDPNPLDYSLWMKPTLLFIGKYIKILNSSYYKLC